ncbi:Rv3235 family protein [Herbiconiux sp. YIM B11900]|uniref:Rv3235 family protein n=1 Tax=Herbiconiux sp. YIM B11900 TaxID=3404131 RepID=UPI003F834AE4
MTSTTLEMPRELVSGPPARLEPEPVDDDAALRGDARALAENLARCVIEILAGTRSLDQIARWLSSDVHAHLMKRVVLSQRARTARGEAPGRLSFRMGSTVVSEPRDGVVEAVVIVHGRARSRAVAIRLEALGMRWRASAVHVL